MSTTSDAPRYQTLPAISEEQLMASRWSFGRPGQPPLTTSFFFGRDGRISGYIKNGPETYWKIENNELRLLNFAGQHTWTFPLPQAGDSPLTLTGRSHHRQPAETGVLTEISATFAAAPVKIAAEAAPAAEGDNRIKLVIWDLDETFWGGTLAEGGITPIAAHIELVKILSLRGIVNSICSKNEFARTKAELERLGIWEYFIFPRIDFAPKGAMIKDIIEAAQLRAPSVLFIDDNLININEALHYNPGLQVCVPEVIASLLGDPRCKGRPDPEMERLARYKVLEQKQADRATGASDNLDFLRNSDIRISFHHELGDEFPRLHDLVNRTNQLNFTKNRWPEDEAQALELFLKEQHQDGAETFHSHWGYVKVSDKYGNYGIVGFYLVRGGHAVHFLFSCRTLNMGIEQFVWHKIGRPTVKTVGEVVSSLGDHPGWITVVDDADATEAKSTSARKTICVRGACDLSMINHYLRMRYETREEFTYPYGHWGIHPAARAVALHDGINTAAGQALIAKMPGLPPRRFESDINSGASEVYVLSFSSEVFCGLYKSRSTGMILPIEYVPIPRKPFSEISWEQVQAKNPRVAYTEEQWTFLQDEFELTGVLDLDLLAADVRVIFEKLRGKTVIVLMLNTEIGNAKWTLDRYSSINNVVGPLADEFGYDKIPISEFVRSTDDLVNPRDGGVHYNRAVYQKLADRISGLIESSQSPAGQEAMAVS